jgi:hypothetical protein
LLVFLDFRWQIVLFLHCSNKGTVLSLIFYWSEFNWRSWQKPVVHSGSGSSFFSIRGTVVSFLLKFRWQVMNEERTVYCDYDKRNTSGGHLRQILLLLCCPSMSSDYPFNWDLQTFLTCRRHDRSVNVYTLHLLNGYEACSCSCISVGRLFYFFTVLTKGLYFLWSSIDLSLIEGHECGVVWLILLREPESPSLSLLWHHLKHSIFIGIIWTLHLRGFCYFDIVVFYKERLYKVKTTGLVQSDTPGICQYCWDIRLHICRWWGLFQKRVMHTKLDIYVFIVRQYSDHVVTPWSYIFALEDDWAISCLMSRDCSKLLDGRCIREKRCPPID